MGSAKGYFLEKVYHEVEKIACPAEHRVLFTNYFGVPQTRNILSIMANKFDKKIEFPKSKLKNKNI